MTIIDGTNVGIIAHVTEVSLGTNTTSITVDKTVGAIGSTGNAESINFHTFKKNNDSGQQASDVYTTADAEYKKYGLMK